MRGRCHLHETGDPHPRDLPSLPTPRPHPVLFPHGTPPAHHSPPCRPGLQDPEAPRRTPGHRPHDEGAERHPSGRRRGPDRPHPHRAGPPEPHPHQAPRRPRPGSPPRRAPRLPAPRPGRLGGSPPLRRRRLRHAPAPHPRGLPVRPRPPPGRRVRGRHPLRLPSATPLARPLPPGPRPAPLPVGGPGPGPGGGPRGPPRREAAPGAPLRPGRPGGTRTGPRRGRLRPGVPLAPGGAGPHPGGPRRLARPEDPPHRGGGDAHPRRLPRNRTPQVPRRHLPRPQGRAGVAHRSCRSRRPPAAGSTGTSPRNRASTSIA